LAIKSSEENQGITWILQTDPKTAVSNKLKTDKQKAKKMAKVDKKQAPEVPMKRPKKIQEIKLRNGKSKIQRYI
jgi:hypothetical protein